jgi:hypothetical protein
MLRLWMGLPVLLCMAPSPQKPYLTTKQVKAAEGSLTLLVPSAFRPMSRQDISIKFPGGSPPQEVWANRDMNVSIAITFPESARLNPEDLTKFGESITQALPKVRDKFKWIRNSEVTINGRRWLRMTFTCSALDTQIYNDMVYTSHKGRVLGVNCNSVVRLRDASEKIFNRTIQSLKILETPPTPPM